MSLVLRLLWLFFGQVLGSRTVGIEAVSRVWSRTLPNDLDLNLHVNNGRLLTFIDFGRLAWLQRTGLLMAGYRKRGIPVVGDVSARYLKPLRLFERFTIETRLLGWSGRWAYFEHRLIRSDGQLAVLVADRGMFWRRRGGAVPIAEMAAELPSACPVSPPLPAWVARWSDSLELGREMLNVEAAAASPGMEVPACATIAVKPARRRPLRLVSGREPSRI
jgi:acyl-CoA thioesterase FadM